jgi:DNA-binding NarL/FixJ family response regulator
MYPLKSANEESREDARPPGTRLAASSESAVLVRDLPRCRGYDSSPIEDAVWANRAPQRVATGAGGAPDGPIAELRTLIYVDPRAFTRHCVGRWLQTNLKGFTAYLLPDPEQITTASIGSDSVDAVIINAGTQGMSSGAVAETVSRVRDFLPAVPVVVLSDYGDAENIRQAFDLGVRGYIPTSLASKVAVGAIHFVCVGGTFAPAAALLSQQGDRPQPPAGEPPIAGFTQRQAQIVDCLQRGMANKLIAYELDMRESTVKVHVRNIMKKLKATNRTQVVYLTRGWFEGHQRASPTREARVAGRSIP